MNAVEIADAVEELAKQEFNADEFPYDFLTAFGNKPATIKRLRKGDTNKSDIGGVLQVNNIHIKVSARGTVSETLEELQSSSATRHKRHRVRFLLATDGHDIEAQEVAAISDSGEPELGELIACQYEELPKRFGFFLPLAGITTVRKIQENSFDIRATSQLNKLYLALLEHDADWGDGDRRDDMNHFMARLIFCFFAEDTDIFSGEQLFTETVRQMSSPDSSNTHEVIGEIFRAMNMNKDKRKAASMPAWADCFPYVNGGLFKGNSDVPKFSKIARTYLLNIGSLDWKKINPDIFGSMIQAVADDEERSALGMHYTSVPNILKLLNPLFLDDLRNSLKEAGGNRRKLLNLRDRISRIRVFDPACGSGNFLVIAYKEIREIEAEINERRNEAGRQSEIELTNFRGIEIRSFSAEIARLALIIAEFQCDMLHRGQKEALREFLPLESKNWITCRNALGINCDWLSICPPTERSVKYFADDLFQTELKQTEIDFENEGGETYICGNPPYKGSTWQSSEQKSDLGAIFEGRTKKWKSLDYVAGWFMKAADYGKHTASAAAFVSTNSICQGQQVPILWPLIFKTGHKISFAHTSFKWANLASHNAGVAVAIVGISNHVGSSQRLFYLDEEGESSMREVAHINAYLAPATDVIVKNASDPLTEVPSMSFGNKPVDGGHLLLSAREVDSLGLSDAGRKRFIRRFYGSEEFIHGKERYSLWIEDKHLEEAININPIRQRVEAVRKMRLASPDKGANKMAKRAHQMREMNTGKRQTIVVPRVSSEKRHYLPVGLINGGEIAGDRCFAIYDAPLWNMALIASRLHLVWIATVCGRLETRYSYSNTLGWNTFPVPKLTETNRADLTRCAEDILLAREAHFPATIAELYNPAGMPDELRDAHHRNDEVIERIYIGRRFKNDTERLEKLFDMYTELTTEVSV